MITDVNFDNSRRDDVLSGGVKMIHIETLTGTFRVWTKMLVPTFLNKHSH